MTRRRIAAALAATALAGLGWTMATAQTGGAGKTVSYKVTADTYSGMGAGMMGARGAGGMLGAMLSGRATDPDAAARMLNLELGSNRPPAGAPAAEHLPPAGLGVGASLPLVTPRPVRDTPDAPDRDEPDTYEKPRGKIMMFWGCGEKARPGQPLVIDIAKLAQGQIPPQLMAMGRGSAGQMMAMARRMGSGAGRRDYATIGLWPNERTRNSVPARGSLVGDHVVRGNYTPEIKFAIAQAQDYLAPFSLTTNQKAPSGAHLLAWRPIPHALGYSAMAFGSPGEDTVVMWTSAEAQSPESPPEFASAGEIARLVQQKMMLAPSVTQCAVPAEAVKALGDSAFLTMNAVGPTSTFSYPPRPAKPPAGWAPDWVTKVQTRATYSGLLGADFAGMGRDAGDAEEDQAEAPQPKKKRKRSLLDGVLNPF